MEENKEINIQIKIDSKELDKTLEKAKELVSLLERANELIQSLK